MFDNYRIFVHCDSDFYADNCAEDFARWVVRDDMNVLFAGCYNHKQICDLICALYSVRLSKIGMYVDRAKIEWNNRVIDLVICDR